MRIRAIHIKGHSKIGDLSVELHQEGRIDEGVWLVGGCGSGKSLISDIIGAAWGSGALNRSLPYVLQGCRARVDFEIDGELIICQADNGRFSGNSALSAKMDRENGRHLLLKYDQGRLSMTGRTGAIGSVYPIIKDLVSGGVKDSVILIDDFDLCLDSGDQKLFWSYLWKNYRSLGNQLIVTGRRGLGVSREVSLSVRENPINLALNEIK